MKRKKWTDLQFTDVVFTFGKEKQHELRVTAFRQHLYRSEPHCWCVTQSYLLGLRLPLLRMDLEFHRLVNSEANVPTVCSP